MQIPSNQKLLEAKVHLGHLSRKWNPAMARYIYKKRGDSHIINIKSTQNAIQQVLRYIDSLYVDGKSKQGNILFVGTKKQAKHIVKEAALSIDMPYITERWLGGFLTNFATIRKALKNLANKKKMMRSKDFENLAKREQLTIKRNQKKQENVFGGISHITRLPRCIFVVDAKKEIIAVKEANRLNIPVIAIVDTDTSPIGINYPIPANDDSMESIRLIVKTITDHIKQFLIMQEAEENTEDKEDTKA